MTAIMREIDESKAGAKNKMVLVTWALGSILTINQTTTMTDKELNSVVRLCASVCQIRHKLNVGLWLLHFPFAKKESLIFTEPWNFSELWISLLLNRTPHCLEIADGQADVIWSINNGL